MTWRIVIALMLLAGSAKATSLCYATNGQSLAGLYCVDLSQAGNSNLFAGCVYSNRQGGATWHRGVDNTDVLMIGNAASALGGLGNNRTIAMWAKILTTNDTRFIAMNRGVVGDSLYSFTFGLVGMKLECFLRGDNLTVYDYALVGTMTNNSWTHIACTYNAATKAISVYQNGNHIGGSTNAGLQGASSYTNGSLGGHIVAGTSYGRANVVLDDVMMTTNIVDIAELYYRTSPATYDDGWHTNYNAAMIYRMECWPITDAYSRNLNYMGAILLKRARGIP